MFSRLGCACEKNYGEKFGIWKKKLSLSGIERREEITSNSGYLISYRFDLFWLNEELDLL